MITHVIALRGHNRGKLGYIRGSLSGLIGAGRQRFYVQFPNQPYPWDMSEMSATSIREATANEIDRDLLSHSVGVQNVRG